MRSIKITIAWAATNADSEKNIDVLYADSPEQAQEKIAQSFAKTFEFSQEDCDCCAETLAEYRVGGGAYCLECLRNHGLDSDDAKPI